MVDLTKFYETTQSKLKGGEVVLEGRPYLGMSQLGHECPRYLWYQFRWAFRDVTSKRMTKLWARGHREEPVIIADLEAMGMTCESTQQEMIAGHGHIKGHNDGTGFGVIEAPKTEHLLEFKTVNDKGFKKLVKEQLKKYSPTYYGQCQLYMHYLKLTRTLFIAVNKNDDDYYVERLEYDKGYAEDLVRKGNYILMAETPPARAYPTKTFFKCNWCSAKNTCWNHLPMEKNCRTCRFSEIATEGEWVCAYVKGTTIEIEEDLQRKGCEVYQEIDTCL